MVRRSRGIAKKRRSRKIRYARKTKRMSSLSNMKILRRKQYLICNPEVKTYRGWCSLPLYHTGTITHIDHNIMFVRVTRLNDVAANLLWPVRGVSDQERIGDSINNVKISLSWTVENRSDSPQDIIVMCVLFKRPDATTPALSTTPCQGFWKWPNIDNNVLNNVVQQENYTVIKQWKYKVNQDKENGTSIGPTKRYTIKYKQPVQFTENSTNPKNFNRDEYYFAFCGYRPATGNLVQIGYINIRALMYYTD